MKRAALIWSVMVVILLAALAAGRVQRPLGALVYDAGAALVTAPPDPRVVLVTIDQDSLDRLGPFPWSRDKHAELVDRLSAWGAALIVFDISFTDATAADAGLAAALGRAGNVYVPVQLNVRSNAPVIAYDGPPASIREAAAGVGHITLPPDSDGVVRRFAVEHAAGDQPEEATSRLGCLPGCDRWRSYLPTFARRTRATTRSAHSGCR